MNPPKHSTGFESFLFHFKPAGDPRKRKDRARHPFVNILVFAVCGCICGADGWDDLAEFAKAQAERFAAILDLSMGTPSADTFRRVLSALKPAAFEACFRAWVASFVATLSGSTVAVDGKAVKGALIHGFGATPLHLVHVWATEHHLLLAQKAVNGAPGEVRAIPDVLRLLDLEGATVTSDANGCTGAVATAAVEGGADYVLALKGNRGKLHDHVRQLFAPLLQGKVLRRANVVHDRTTHEAHGRHEVRELWALPMNDWPLEQERWPGLTTAILIKRERTEGDNATVVEWHTYLSSLPPMPKKLMRTIRGHWGIENGLHWCLDVGFGEDRRRIRDAAGAENFALISRIAFTLLKNERTSKRGIAAKRKAAGWNFDYLLRVLTSGISAV